MNSKPLITVGGIIVVLIIIARLSKLRHLPADVWTWLLPVALVIGVLILIFFARMASIQAKSAAQVEDAMEAGRQEIRRRVIAAGLATSENVNQVIRAMSNDDFKRIRAELTYIHRRHF